MSLQAEKINVDQIFLYKSKIEIDRKFLDGNNVKIIGFKFSNESSTGVNFENDLFKIKLEISFFAVGEGEKELDIHASFGVEFSFTVSSLKNFIEEDGKKGMMIKEELGVTLMSISYSTMRGIILQETKSTLLGSVILPIIDPKKLLKADKTF